MVFFKLSIPMHFYSKSFPSCILSYTNIDGKDVLLSSFRIDQFIGAAKNFEVPEKRNHLSEKGNAHMTRRQPGSGAGISKFERKCIPYLIPQPHQTPQYWQPSKKECHPHAARSFHTVNFNLMRPVEFSLNSHVYIFYIVFVVDSSKIILLTPEC